MSFFGVLKQISSFDVQRESNSEKRIDGGGAFPLFDEVNGALVETGKLRKTVDAEILLDPSLS